MKVRRIFSIDKRLADRLTSILVKQRISLPQLIHLVVSAVEKGLIDLEKLEITFEAEGWWKRHLEKWPDPVYGKRKRAKRFKLE